jgi:L-ascorbate metabolism protein UlaG (beta-lactamase superfamily)
MPTRRHLLASAAAATVPVILPYAAMAAAHGGDMFPVPGGEIKVHPIDHASFVMEVPGLVIYCDPVGDPAAYSAHPAPDLILVTHEHGDHYNADTLAALAGEATQLVTNPAVFEMLPEALKARATALINGASATVGTIGVSAIPAYNTTEDRKKYHPQGRDNGYVLNLEGARVYIAGDTEDIPEMRALEGIDIAFVPMNLPYTMSIEQAASAVNAFRPKYVYPYHYKGSDPVAFAALVTGPEVKQGPWYG